MKTNSTQQEILLLTGTTFSAQQLVKNDGAENEKTLNEMEQLEDACWDGLLPSMLPEICSQPSSLKRIYLWEVKEANHFIELEFGELPEKTDSYYSIDPYSFLAEKSCN